MLADATEESIDADKSVAKIQKDVDDPDSNFFGKESKEEQAEDLEALKNERTKAAELEIRRLTILDQLIKAQSAPIVVAPSSTVNEAPKTTNNVSTSASLKPAGTTGAVANGTGSMAPG